jgi:cell wall-associated NlpC family hydrolase
MSYRINVNITDVWAKPEFNSERTNQALFNEPIKVLENGQQYSLVKLSDGYEGYVKNDFISDVKELSGEEYVILKTLATAYITPDKRAPVATILPFTSVVKINQPCKRYVSCLTNRYGEIFLDDDDVITLGQTPKLTRKTIPIFLKSVKRFIGVPYLWGGRSFFGLDCSGLIQLNCKFFGVDLPRDTKDQIKFGKEVSRDEIMPGDLLFFERHVALAISDKDYIHSSLSRGGVYINSLDPSRDNYLKDRDHDLKTVRRIIED